MSSYPLDLREVVPIKTPIKVKDAKGCRVAHARDWVSTPAYLP
jgi:hypothetical protein